MAEVVGYFLFCELTGWSCITNVLEAFGGLGLAVVGVTEPHASTTMDVVDNFSCLRLVGVLVAEHSTFHDRINKETIPGRRSMKLSVNSITEPDQSGRCHCVNDCTTRQREEG